MCLYEWDTFYKALWRLRGEKFSYLPFNIKLLLNHRCHKEPRRKRSGVLLSGPKSCFQMKDKFKFHLEFMVLESEARRKRHRMQTTESLLWIFQFFHCVQSQHNNVPGDCIKTASRFLLSDTCPNCQNYYQMVSWSCAWLVNQLADLNPTNNPMGYCQEEDEKHKLFVKH